MKTIHIIGAGGVGSWLTPAMCLLQEPENICVIDGDILERKNLNRQLFTERDIGKSKAEALAEKYGCRAMSSWYSNGLIEVSKMDWILCCVDNNPARADVLATCDEAKCRAIFGANETHSSEAYYYEPSWKGTKLDPRVYYPEIESDKSDDPRRASIGCTGEAQRQNRQLVTANFMAAALMQHMFVLWSMERPKLDKEALPHLPFKSRQNLTKTETFKVKDA
jgi:molybdopterin/thiamine biosynthesis adenylyltransferase